MKGQQIQPLVNVKSNFSLKTSEFHRLYPKIIPFYQQSAHLLQKHICNEFYQEQLILYWDLSCIDLQLRSSYRVDHHKQNYNPLAHRLQLKLANQILQKILFIQHLPNHFIQQFIASCIYFFFKFRHFHLLHNKPFLLPFSLQILNISNYKRQLNVVLISQQFCFDYFQLLKYMHYKQTDLKEKIISFIDQGNQFQTVFNECCFNQEYLLSFYYITVSNKQIMEMIQMAVKLHLLRQNSKPTIYQSFRIQSINNYIYKYQIKKYLCYNNNSKRLLYYNNQSLLHFNRMTLKQEYLHLNGPFTFNFTQERINVKKRIIQIMNSFHPNQWLIRGFQPLSMLQSFKQVYGLYSQQLIQIAMMLLGYLRDAQLCCQANITILKTLSGLKQFKISLNQTLKFDNKFFIDKIKTFVRTGIPYPLKNSDSFMENLIKVIKNYCKFGQQYFTQISQLAVQERDIKYIAIFIKSIKSQDTAQLILNQIFQQSSVFQRETPFYFIISELIQQFPLLNLEPYYQTLSQQIIKTITTIIDPTTDQQVKKLITQDPFIGVRSTVSSMAKILVYWLKPVQEPGWEKTWSYIQRIFSIVGGLVDHTHQVQCMNDFLVFIKEFVKTFLARARKQRGIYKQVNQDFVQDFHNPCEKNLVIGQKYLNLFYQIWIPLIPQLLYIEDGQVLSAKILSDLAMFDPQKYLSYILQQIHIYLQKDLTICSTYTSKMTILFLQQFIIAQYVEKPQFTQLIQCCSLMLDALQKLGISQNLDMLELVMRCYMYFPENMVQQNQMIVNLTEDIIQIIQKNLDPMSINLQSTQGQEAQLYTDFKNIYFNFLVRLNEKQIQAMCDKILYKIKTMVPGHRQAYEFVVVVLSYKNPDFAKKVLDTMYKQIVTHFSQMEIKNGDKVPQKSLMTQIAQQIFPNHINKNLATKNQQNLKWYSSIVQCAFQYNPMNVVANWNRIEAIITLMLRQFDRPAIFDMGLDILFNIIINLENIHLQPIQYYKNSNRKYETMKGINWIHPTPQCITLLQHIKVTFYQQITNFMKKRYQNILQKSEKAQKIRSQRIIQVIFDRTQTTIGPKPIQVKQFINQLLDCLLVPSTPTPQDLQQKKIINKLISIQYSVFSALQMRTQFTANDDMFEIQPVFIKSLGCFRKHAIQHLKWVLQLLGHYNCLYDPNILKIFHYFWRQAHDEFYFSIGIMATNQKLSPFFYPTAFKKKQIFQNSFLIMTQCYLTFMMRIELFGMIKPLAHLNNPQYLQYLVPFSYASSLDCSLKSYIPANIDPHISYHFQIINICRLKLCLYASNSYIRKFIVYSKAGNQGINKLQKQKYLGAIRVIVNNYRRNMSIFAFPCCIRDQTTWYALQETLQISQYLEKKVDKVGIIEIIYLLVVFSFDFKGNNIYQTDIRLVQKNLVKMTQSDLLMKKKIVNYIKFLMQKISVQINKKFYQKDATVLVLLLICFSQFVPLHNEIYKQIIPFVIQITAKDTQDMMNIGKSFLFRILNRFVKKKTNITSVENEPVKRKFQDFLVFRHIGGKTEQNSLLPPSNLITSKTDNYYFPLSKIQYLQRTPLNSHQANQALLLSKITDQQTLKLIFKSLLTDTQLKFQQSQVDVSYLSEEQPKKIYSNGHKLINYILDNNPKKLNIFLSFIDNFSNYAICFYHRLFRKMMILGGNPTVKILQKITKQHIKSTQKQQVKLCQFLLSQILPFSFNDEQFYTFYTNFLASCSKQQFQFANGCLMVTFCIDWKISKIIFNKIIQRMRLEKGPSRLRHLQVFNNYLICAGRFANEQAKNGIQYLMRGIEQGTDQVSQLLVSMLIYCFIIPINLKILPNWINQSPLQLFQNKKIYKLDANTGYQINEQINLIITQIIKKTKQQKSLQSKNLMIYSKLTYKILSNITVYRFNDQFYRLFKQMMLYIVNKPIEQGTYDQQIIDQLKNSQYPQHIYQNLIKQLNNMQGNTINVMKKKINFIENIVINKIYCNNQIDIPDIFNTINQKNIIIDHIVAISNMARLMTGSQLTHAVENILGNYNGNNNGHGNGNNNNNNGNNNNKQKNNNKNSRNLYFMMAYLLAAGTRNFAWRQKLLNQILSYKKSKIVKQFISYWWKGRTPQTQIQQRLYTLVRNVENPYSYFA